MQTDLREYRGLGGGIRDCSSVQLTLRVATCVVKLAMVDCVYVCMCAMGKRDVKHTAYGILSQKHTWMGWDGIGNMTNETNLLLS
jgi:hypothetical protein